MYKYYAVIEKEKLDQTGCFIVSFPDIENCFTDAETLVDAVQNAHDVLGLMMTDYEDEGNVPPASKPEDIKLPTGSSLVLIEIDTDEYREAV